MKIKNFLTIIIIIVAILVCDTIVSTIYRPFGVSLYTHALTTTVKAHHYLTEKYPDDHFVFKGVSVDRRGELFDWSPEGYCYDFYSPTYKSDVNVWGSLTGTDFYDRFSYTKYNDKVDDTITSSLDSFFGKDNYSLVYKDLSNQIGSDNALFDEGLYSYIAYNYTTPLMMVVNSDYKYDTDELSKRIVENLKSIVDTSKYSFDIRIYFDRDDDFVFPAGIISNSTLFFQYRDLNLWDKELTITNKRVNEYDYKNPQYTDLECKWVTNNEKNYQYKTKNKFLNGKKIEFRIDDFSFFIDGNTTVGDLENSITPNIHLVGNSESYIKPHTYYTDEFIIKGDIETRINFTYLNDTDEMQMIKNTKICGISFGDTFDVDDISYYAISVDGMKIGDTVTEKGLVDKYGEFESNNTNKNNDDICYNFVDGEATLNDMLDGTNNKLYLVVRDGKIKNIGYTFYKYDDFYDWDYHKYDNNGKKTY